MSALATKPEEEIFKEALNASIKFEELMDGIDFDSYLLPQDEKTEIKETVAYQKNLERITAAKKVAVDTITKASSNPIIKQLFEGKIKRLEARMQVNYKSEKDDWFDAIHLLNKALDLIPPEDLKGDIGAGFFQKNNWAKILLYNELSICYTGPRESSISLGFARRSTALLEHFIKISSNDQEIDPLILLLYTFALFNKGEAERLLSNQEQALKTFEQIFQTYKDYADKLKDSFNDFDSGSLRVAMMLIESGRGDEALENLKNVRIEDTFDYRFHDIYLQRATAYIDMKNYPEAFEILDNYKKPEYALTFIGRKAIVEKLRLALEFVSNNSLDFSEKKTQLSKDIFVLFECFEKTAENLLVECVDRQDSRNFRKACDRLADYFHVLKKQAKDNNEKQTNIQKELKNYYLYLCDDSILEKGKTGNSKSIINSWFSTDELKNLVNQYEKSVDFCKKIRKSDDEHYLENFFETYIGFTGTPKNIPDNKADVISILHEQLTRLFHEKDNLTKEEQIREKYANYLEKTKSSKGVNEKSESANFISDYFFKGELSARANPNICLNSESILNKMKNNTRLFAGNVVGRSSRFRNDGDFHGTFCILRRWNSFTPALTSAISPSKGGGYFFYFAHQNESVGIVIDPGYNFLENLLSCGFRIGDIDAVVVSHAHPDHTDDLSSLLSLFYEANNRLGEYHYAGLNTINFNKKHRRLILSQGVFDQYYKGFIKSSEKCLQDIIVVKVSKEGRQEKCTPIPSLNLGDYLITIEAFPTYHGDLAGGESLGFIVGVTKDKKVLTQVACTSDVHWTKGLSKKLKDCNIVCAHLGSIVDVLKGKEFCNLCEDFKKEEATKKCTEYQSCKKGGFKNGKSSNKKLLEQAMNQKHLYLGGLAILFEELLKEGKMELGIISEFGEELKGGIRIDLYRKFDDWFQKSNSIAKCFAGDIGMEVEVMTGDVLCMCCQEFKPKTKISPITYGREEAIFFICDECKAILSTYQIGEKLREYYFSGRKLDITDESRNPKYPT